MAKILPDDKSIRARMLQNIEGKIGSLTPHEHIGIVITAHWIECFGILHFKWDWSPDTHKEIATNLNDNIPGGALPKEVICLVDNLSEAGRRAVFMIDGLFPQIDKVVNGARGLKGLEKTHQWLELVRNAVT